MARTATARHAIGLNNIGLVGNASLTLATSYLEIESPLSGGVYTNFDPDSDSWTASLWVYLTHTGISTDYNYSISILAQTDSDGGSSATGGTNTGRNWLSSNVSTGQFSANLGNVSRLSGFVPQPNTWYFVTLVRDKPGQTFAFYVNGVAYNSFSGVASFESCTGKMRIGANRGPQRSMGGAVEKPRLIKGLAMTPAQILALYTNDTVPGTAAQKEFEIIGCTGSGVPVDSGINAYTLTFNNGAYVNTDQLFLKFPSRIPVERTPVNRIPA